MYHDIFVVKRMLAQNFQMLTHKHKHTHTDTHTLHFIKEIHHYHTLYKQFWN